jgi:hypothetical protein
MSKIPFRIRCATNPLATTERTPLCLSDIMGIQHAFYEDHLYSCGGGRQQWQQRTIPRALAAYYRVLTRHHHGDLPLGDLPSYICEETTERDYVIVRMDARTLAVYRVRPDGPLRRLKRWSQDLKRRLEGHGPHLAKISWERGEPRTLSPSLPSSSPDLLV